MIPEKVTWVRFPARINTVYSKLPPINDLFLNILNQTYIFTIKFLPEYQIRKFFSYVASEYSSLKEIVQLFVQLFLFFYTNFAIPKTIPFYFIFAMLLTGNFQLKNQSFPTNAFEAAEFWCIVGLTAVLCLL